MKLPKPQSGNLVDFTMKWARTASLLSVSANKTRYLLQSPAGPELSNETAYQIHQTTQ